jgi:hypothetical protein
MMPRIIPVGGSGGSIKGTAADLGSKAAQAAVSQEGVPYRFGGRSPKGSSRPGFDCSGLTSWAWGQAGKQITRTTFTQYAAMKPISKSNLQAGDLLFYVGSDGTRAAPGHVVMYLGGGKVVQAAHSGTAVAARDVFWGGYVGARRPYGVAQVGGTVSSSGGAVAGPDVVSCLPGGGCPSGYKPQNQTALNNSQKTNRAQGAAAKSAASKTCLCVKIGSSLDTGIHIPNPLSGIEGIFAKVPRYLEIGGGGVVLIAGILVAIFGATGEKIIGGSPAGRVIGAVSSLGGGGEGTNAVAPSRQREVAIRLMRESRARGRPISYRKALRTVGTPPESK